VITRSLMTATSEGKSALFLSSCVLVGDHSKVWSVGTVPVSWMEWQTSASNSLTICVYCSSWKPRGTSLT
jgi:hypothetical protein